MQSEHHFARMDTRDAEYAISVSTSSAVVQSAGTSSVTSAPPGPVTTEAQPTILAIDPGNTESGWCTINPTTRQPINFGKIPNRDLANRLRNLWIVEHVAIEMVASYGMPVGADVFETCVWIGRFAEATRPTDAALIYRRDVKLHHCHSGKATDATIKQALIDRFASGVRNHGKGTKAQPGWFHGFRADIWQAYALAVYVADTHPISVSASASLPGVGAGTDNQTAALSLPRDGAAPAPHPNPMRGCGAGPQTPGADRKGKAVGPGTSSTSAGALF